METREVDGTKWALHDLLVVGDYVGAGVVGEANLRTLREDYKDKLTFFTPTYYMESFEEGIVRVLEENPDVLIVIFLLGHGYQGAWLRSDNEDMKKILDDLENYCLIDCDSLCEVEREWEERAWECYAKDELVRFLEREENEELEERLDALTESEREAIYWQAYMSAVEIESEYPEFECNSAWIPTDKIKHTWLQRVEWELDNPYDQRQIALPN